MVKSDVCWAVFNKGKKFPIAFFQYKRHAEIYWLTKAHNNRYEVRAVKIKMSSKTFYTIYEHKYKII